MKTIPDIHDLGIQGEIVTPSSTSYIEAIRRQSGLAILQPAYVVFPSAPTDIPLVIKFALSHDPPLEIAVKSGGCHSSTNASTNGGIVVDLARLKAVIVAEDRKTVSIQGGCLWGDVYSELEKYDLIVVGGNTWFVGVGGYLTGGGYSNLTGQHGLAVDNLVGAEVVLADGRIVRCSEVEEPDLFWAIRGGGNQFGIVTEFVVKAHPARGPALTGALVYPATALQQILPVLHEFLENQPPTSYLNVGFARMAPDFDPSIIVVPYIEGDPPAAETLLSPFRTRVTPMFAQTTFAPTFNIVSHGVDPFLLNAPPRSVIAGACFSRLYDDILEWVLAEWLGFTEREEFKQSLIMFEFWRSGTVDAVPVSATAHPVRVPHWYLAMGTRHTKPEFDDEAKEWAVRITSFVKTQNTRRTGQKLCTPSNFSIGPDYDMIEEVYGENLPRLRKVKAKYDPEKVWRRGWVIEPEF